VSDSKKPEPIMSRLDWAAFLLVVSVALIEGWLFFGPGAQRRAESGTDAEADSAIAMSLMEAMGGDDDAAAYDRAMEPRDFVFPEDHGAHPGFRTEWWYVTSNLFAEDGRRFGSHFTIFRSALTPPDRGEPMAPASGDGGDVWRTSDVYMGHFALADPEAGTFTEAERFTRGSARLAGTRTGASAGTTGDEGAGGFRVWMDDWEMAAVEGTRPGADGIFPLRLHARDPDQGIAIDLIARPEKPVVLQGDAGLSQKGDEPGNASYYYSFTRLRTEGTVVTAEGDTVAVTGQAWMDREWSTSALDETQAGWDWFALQLDDGRDLMVYRLRGVDGSTDPLSEGVLLDGEGVRTRLAADDFRLSVVESWTSDVDGAEYPSTWRVEVPSEGIALRVEPVLRDQEMNVTVRYWEGAVDLYDADAGRGAEPLGRGYVELTGYAGTAPPGG